MERCKWVNLKNKKYVDYHDNEWGKREDDERYLFEMLILEGFQAGLSWECILNKREDFRKAFEDFNYEKISQYDYNKINELLNNPNIIRNKLKINAAITNARIFMQIQKEFGSFDKYIWGFSNNKVIKNMDDNLKTTSELSDTISKDLRKRGMKFVGSTIIYSYLQAIGIINDHELKCYLYNTWKQDYKICSPVLLKLFSNPEFCF